MTGERSVLFTYSSPPLPAAVYIGGYIKSTSRPPYSRSTASHNKTQHSTQLTL
ncbi:unnamed protein product [Staurois parvus]|uniref:Uncharacterized protein n=1 Tax=Staurois parvus TaxID=386267 RepID=A0ABN9CXH2_9NEOB|nr:unnamed protein product [Staurois parvus]